MPLNFEARDRPSGVVRAVAPVVAIALTGVFGLVLFWLLGHSPVTALHAYFVAPVSSVRGLAELALSATPLVLCAVGLAVGFRANVWNIGAEGQLLIGATCGGGFALMVQDFGGAGPCVLPAMLVAGIGGGMAWAAIPAVLKVRFGASEILTSLMLTYVAGLVLGYAVHGPLRDPDGFGFPESKLFEDDALLPILVAGTRLNLAAPLALGVAAVAWLAMARSLIGFELKVIGVAPHAATYAGFSPRRAVWIGFLVSGGLAGLAGVCEVAGPIGQLTPEFSPGYGFTAIIVAFLGRLHPLGIVLAGLVMALTYLGAEQAKITLGLPEAVTGVFQGMVLFFLLATDGLAHLRVRWRRTRPAEAGA